MILCDYLGGGVGQPSGNDMTAGVLKDWRRRLKRVALEAPAGEAVCYRAEASF